MTKDDEIVSDILKSQLKTYPASTVTILSAGDFESFIPAGKFKSVKSVDINKKAVVISNLEPSDLLITNLLLEKMGYAFFINVLKKVKPQFVCCSFHVGNSLGVTEEELTSRLLQESYELFSRSEVSLSNGKTLIQLDFTVSSLALGTSVPAKSSYKVSGKELLSLSVYNVGTQKCEPLYQWGPGVRDFYLIHYIISGKGTYVSGHNEYKLKAGDCFLSYPHMETTYYADSEDPWEYAWVGFTGTEAGLILDSTDFTRDEPYIRGVSHGKEIQELIGAIYKAKGNSFSSGIHMTGKLYELLGFFVEDAASEPVQMGAKLYVQSAMDYISENYSNPVSIEDIAAFVGISRSQLFRCFQRIAGISPKEYLTRYRIKKACQLLAQTSFSMTAIANSLGFENSLYFSKAFRKVQGVSPSEYRSQIQES